MTSLSVIVPTFNRAAAVKACLTSLFEQSHPRDDYEIIVVVDGSTDGTWQVVTELAAEYPLRALWQPNSGVARARNHGIRAATGAACLFIDDDIIAGPNLVNAHVAAQRTSGGAVVLGHLAVALPRRAGRFAEYVADWWVDHSAQIEHGARKPIFMDCFTGNLSAPSAAIRDVGCFATDLSRNEDIELGFRLHEAGLPIVSAPDASACQLYSKNTSSIARDAERSGSSAVEIYRRHPKTIDAMPLGSFNQTNRYAVLLRRMLLRLHVPHQVLTPAGSILPGPWAGYWYRFVTGYCYWVGARDAARKHDLWAELVSRGAGPERVLSATAS